MLIPGLENIDDDGGVSLSAKKKLLTLDSSDDSISNTLPAAKLAKLHHKSLEQLDTSDCPYPEGSLKAKLWLKTVLDPQIKANATQQIKEQYGDETKGFYHNRPLRVGNHPGDGDFEYLVDKIKLTQGLDTLAAKKIAGAIRWRLYPR